MSLTAEQRSRLDRVARAIVNGQEDVGVNLSSFGTVIEQDPMAVIEYLRDQVNSFSNQGKSVQPVDRDLVDQQFSRRAIYLAAFEGGPGGLGTITELKEGMVIIGLVDMDNGYFYGMKPASARLVENRRLNKVQVISDKPSDVPDQSIPDPTQTMQILTGEQLVVLKQVVDAIALRVDNDDIELWKLVPAFNDEIGRGAIVNYLQSQVNKATGGGTHLHRADPAIFLDQQEGSWLHLVASRWQHHVNVNEDGTVAWPLNGSVLIAIAPIMGGYVYDAKPASMGLVTTRRQAPKKLAREDNGNGAELLPPAPSTDQAKQEFLSWIYEALKEQLRTSGNLLGLRGLESTVGNEVTLDKLIEAADLIGTTLEEVITDKVFLTMTGGVRG